MRFWDIMLEKKGAVQVILYCVRQFSCYFFSSHNELMFSPSQFATRGLFMPEERNSLIVQEISQELRRPRFSPF